MKDRKQLSFLLPIKNTSVKKEPTEVVSNRKAEAYRKHSEIRGSLREKGIVQK